MGRRGPKPKFNEVACPNAKCADYGIKGKGNVTANGTYKTINGRVRKFIIIPAAESSAIGRIRPSTT
jgi:hypothetical protein